MNLVWHFFYRFISNVAAVINIVCFLNLSLGVEIWMALFYLFLRPFSGPLVRRLVRTLTTVLYINYSIITTIL